VLDVNGREVLVPFIKGVRGDRGHTHYAPWISEGSCGEGVREWVRGHRLRSGAFAAGQCGNAEIPFSFNHNPKSISQLSSIMPPATSIAIPGQLLGSANDYIPGPGTHIHNGNLYASILGPIQKTIPPKPPGPQKRLNKIAPSAPVLLPTISIDRGFSLAEANSEKKKSEILPEVGSTVLCKVTRIAPKQASVAILVVGDTVLDGEWQGVIRVQDVRATEKDKVKIFESFRPGDIVRAVVVNALLLNYEEHKLTVTARSHLVTSRTTTSLRPATI
jgi:exosome complex component CSL4